MMDTIVIAFPGNELLAGAITAGLGLETGKIELRDFPDGESYVRIESDVRDKTVILTACLDHPNNKIIPLIFTARTLKELGARKICLITPYLPYMRQDQRFKAGEAVSCRLFADMLSGLIDQLITIDPHLHRIHDLAGIYPGMTVSVLHAANAIATWIRRQIDSPFIIGPDEESRQWAAQVAELAGAQYGVIAKVRSGDKDVSITLPDFHARDKTPVLIDDIISTGMTMLAAVRQLIAKGYKKPVCIGVHALFDRDINETLLRSGAQKIVSCNTISHFSNAIDVTDVIIEGLKN